MITFKAVQPKPLKNPRTSFHFQRSRRGAAAVEFALVAPFFILLVLGMIELSRGMMVKGILSNAARKGCNTGIKPAKTDTDIKNDVNNILAENNISLNAATITILVNDKPYDPNNPPKALDKVSVQVTVPVSAIFWGGTTILSGTVIESETILMMRQS
jgi:Flp pilus assembly protein TadG